MNKVKCRTTSSRLAGASRPATKRCCSDNWAVPNAVASSASVPWPSAPTTVFQAAKWRKAAPTLPTRASSKLVATSNWLVWNSGSLPSLSSTSALARRWLL